MKLTQDQKDTINKCWGDWEALHGNVDLMIRNRLNELDPEFITDIEEITKDATFWFA